MASPDGLGKRGKALWESLGFDADTANGVLALEAARAADRLDELDSVIQGKGVLELMQFRVPHAVDDQGAVTVEVKFDNVLGEARQQQNVLRQLLVTLASVADSPAKAAAPAVPVASVTDEFTKRRRSRGA